MPHHFGDFLRLLHRITDKRHKPLIVRRQQTSWKVEDIVEVLADHCLLSPVLNADGMNRNDTSVGDDLLCEKLFVKRNDSWNSISGEFSFALDL